VRASLTFAILCGLFLLVDGMVNPYASPEPASSGSKNPSLTDHFVPGEVLVRFSEAGLAVKDISHIRAGPNKAYNRYPSANRNFERRCSGSRTSACGGAARGHA